jgi:hypothetical protein
MILIILYNPIITFKPVLKGNGLADTTSTQLLIGCIPNCRISFDLTQTLSKGEGFRTLILLGLSCLSLVFKLRQFGMHPSPD